MQEITKTIGRKLKAIRKKRILSLDKAAELTGVSKAMLGQVERGESNPTVATLWKIASGLKVSFSSFLEEEQPSEEVIFLPQEDLLPMKEEDGLMKIFPLFCFDSKRGFEIFTIQLEPGCYHISEPHNDSVEEYIIVTEGSMELVIEENIYPLKKGDSLRYYANKQHTYRNIADVPASFLNLIHYFAGN